MVVVASCKVKKKKRIYHKSGCIYAKRIKVDNCIKMSIELAQRKKLHECKYCAGFNGDVKIHKKKFARWAKKKNMKFTYSNEHQILFVQTELGLWKIRERWGDGKYLLFHYNNFIKELSFDKMLEGKYHRQADVKPEESLEKIVDYIDAHDRAKAIIKDDYRKLPRNTKMQKRYYEAAKRKEKRKAVKRLDMLFKMVEGASVI